MGLALMCGCGSARAMFGVVRWYSSHDVALVAKHTLQARRRAGLNQLAVALCKPFHCVKLGFKAMEYMCRLHCENATCNATCRTGAADYLILWLRMARLTRMCLLKISARCNLLTKPAPWIRCVPAMHACR